MMTGGPDDTTSDGSKFNRRLFLGGTAAAALTGLAGPVLAQQSTPGSTMMEGTISQTTRRNTSSFRTLQWQPYFSNLNNGAILVDITSRALHYWGPEGQVYRLYPTSVPATADLTRRGRTSVTQKVEGPSWRPTPAMKKRDPDWPDFIGPGPENPLGTHALYLSWTYYRIHGTQDTRKIGRASSNGCIGLYNEHIAELFGMADVGTPVLLV